MCGHIQADRRHSLSDHDHWAIRPMHGSLPSCVLNVNRPPKPLAGIYLLPITRLIHDVTDLGHDGGKKDDSGVVIGGQFDVMSVREFGGFDERH